MPEMTALERARGALANAEELGAAVDDDNPVATPMLIDAQERHVAMATAYALVAIGAALELVARCVDRGAILVQERGR